MLRTEWKQLNTSPISIIQNPQKINNSLQKEFKGFFNKNLPDKSNSASIVTALDFDNSDNKKPAQLVTDTGLKNLNIKSNVMITKEVATVQASTGKKSVNPDKQEKTRKSDIAVDTEFQTQLDDKTLPICTILNDPTRPDIGKKIFLHPNTPIPEDKRLHPTFKAPLAMIDYYGWQWRYRDAVKKPKNYQNVDLNIFWSYKDIEFNCADEILYRKYILPYLDRIRRIRNLQVLSFPIDVFTEGSDGVMRWRCLTVDISDISAMQGAEGLLTYASNVGLDTDGKDEYTSDEKSRMIQNYFDDVIRFEKYSLGIETDLLEIKQLTTAQYNNIAKNVLGIEEKESWGLSTGKIVASMVSEWLASKLGIKVADIYKLSSLASPESIKTLSKLINNKNLLYLGMTDGGRAVKERDIDCIVGALVDIDIDGCYGNGLKNQYFAVGQPDIIGNPIKFKDFLKKYQKQLIPGLWTARISWNDATFNQDLLISKVEEVFTIWDMAVSGDNEGFILSDEDKIYEASMVLTTQSIKNACLNHDLLQVLRKIASNQEWGWILENAVIESASLYQAKNEVTEVTQKMLDGVELIEDSEHLLKCSKQWVKVDLSELADKLIKERKKFPKGTSLNVFLKLIINTIYGTIASAFFSNEIAGISNYVIGNNITARARTLGWCMAKGLFTISIITDGGVFDVNQVLNYSRMSLDLLEKIHRGVLIDNKKVYAETTMLLGKHIVTNKTLFKQLLTPEDLKNLPSKIKFNVKKARELAKNLNKKFTSKDLALTVKSTVKSTALKHIDLAAWEHLAKIFNGIDIFKFNQFKFESKDTYTKLTTHSKVDYRLNKFNGESTIALRGMNRIYDPIKKKKVNNPLAHELFDAVEENRPHRIEIETEQILSLADWKKHERKEYLLPHDTVRKKTRFYSITHLGTRFRNYEHYKRFHKLYMKAKDSDNAVEIAKIREILEEEFN